MSEPATKRCTKCGEVKPLTEFHRHATCRWSWTTTSRSRPAVLTRWTTRAHPACNRRKTNTTDREAAKAFRAQAPASVQPLGKFAKAFMSGALVALAFGVLGGQMKWVSDAHQYEKERHGGHGDDGQWAHDDPGVRGA